MPTLAPWAWIALAVLCSPRIHSGTGSPSETGASDPVSEMNLAVGLLEQGLYREARVAFDSLTARHPDWAAAHANEGIALLHGGIEGNPAEGHRCAEASFRRALALDPASPQALLGLGAILSLRGDPSGAVPWLRRLTEIDARDPHALFALASSLLDLGETDEARQLLERVLQLKPEFASAHYRLFRLHLAAGDPDLAARHRDGFLRSQRIGILPRMDYGGWGRYGEAVPCTAPPGWTRRRPERERQAGPRFGPPQAIETERATVARPVDPDSDLPPAFAACDLDLDGSPELVIPGQAAPDGAGTFTGVHARREPDGWTLVQRLPGSLLCAAGDLDTDGDIDLVLATGAGLSLFLNDGAGTLSADAARHAAGRPVRLACGDLDADGDPELLCLRRVSSTGGGSDTVLEVLENVGERRFRVRDIVPGGLGPSASELIVADLDDDADPDVLVLGGGGSRARLLENARGWAFVETSPGDWPSLPGRPSATLGDLDGNGLPDIVLLSGESIRLLANRGGLRFEEDAAFTRRHGAVGGTCAVIGDLVGSLRPGLLVLDPKAGGGHPVFLPGPGVDRIAATDLDGVSPGRVSAAMVLDSREASPELVILDSGLAARSHRLSSEGSWTGVRVRRPKRAAADGGSPAGVSTLGVRVEVCDGERRAVFRAPPAGGGNARTPGCFCWGSDDGDAVDLVRIRWPDGNAQTEVSLQAGRVHCVKERAAPGRMRRP